MDRKEVILRTTVLTAALMKGYVLSYEDMHGKTVLKVDELGDVWIKEKESEEFIKTSAVVDIKFLQGIVQKLNEIQYLEVRNYLSTQNFRWQ